MINVNFDSLDEMLSFANRLATLGQNGPGPVPMQEIPAPVQSTPVQQVPAMTAPIQTHPAPTTGFMNIPDGVEANMPIQTQAAPTTPPQNTAPTQQIPAQVQTTASSYTMDDLTKAAVMLMDSGRQADLLNLLAQFGVEALPALPQEQYGAFATALRGLGAQI
ncbi:hypothetical protein [Lacrimispora sp. JR3]|uniref:hypothetical protein n=1 Tax=Lacrimispora sinapis TaxID=3111456 RepID=UPI00374930ED